MAEMGDASRLPERLSALASDVRCKHDFYKGAYYDYLGISNALHHVMEETGKLQHEQNAVVKLVAEKDQLVAEKDQVIAAKDQVIAELIAEKDELTKRNSGLKEQFQARESTDALQESGFQHHQPGRVQTRSMWSKKRQSEGHCEEADEDIEDTRKEISDIHSKLIKGFIDINNTGGRNIAIKYIGELNHKPFLSACLKKLPPKEAKEKAFELYYFWKEQLLNPEWNPLKKVTVGGIPEEIIDVHDDKLQELHAAWGKEVHNAVANCLMEMKECGLLRDRTVVPEVWNFKGNRKATLSESVDYMCSQVKRLKDTQSRMTRRTHAGGSGCRSIN